jgi:hypothetical protein
LGLEFVKSFIRSPHQISKRGRHESGRYLREMERITVNFRCRPPATDARRLTLDDNELTDSITEDRQRRRRRDDLLLPYVSAIKYQHDAQALGPRAVVHAKCIA